MICRVDGAVRRGRVVTLDEDLHPETVARAVRDGRATEDGTTVAVTARTPHPVHERVGCLSPEMALRIRTALAIAARARGLGTPYDRTLQRARQRLAAFEDPDVETKAARKRLATAQAETDRLRERVATIRGRVQARETHDLPTDPAREQLEDAARKLSEVETEATAARQSLDREQQRARRAREDLEERFRLEDRVGNFERRARAHLVEQVRDAYAAAVADVPGVADPSDPFGVDSLSAGLAVARVADFDTPVVIAGERFESARAASRWLGAPVVRV